MGGSITKKIVAGTALVAASFLPTGKAAAEQLEGQLTAPTSLEQVLPSKTPAQQRVDEVLASLGSDVYVSSTLKLRLADGVASKWDVKSLDATIDTQKARHGRKHPRVVAMTALKDAVEQLKDSQPRDVTRAEDKKDEAAGKDEVRREHSQQEIDATFRGIEARMEIMLYLRNQGFVR